MADISQKELREEITAILKDADLTTTSAKKVRQQIEKKLDIDLSDRKKEVDDLVMECLQEKQDEKNDDDDEEEEEEDEEEEEEEFKPKSRGPAKKPAKRKKGSDSESEDEDEASDEEYSPKKKTAFKKLTGGKAPPKKSKGSDDSDDDWKQPKKKASPKKAPAKKGGGGFTKVYNLTPELAAVVGSDSMARHEVVKKVWAIIKERNLYDPKNKQYAICDDQMLKVFKVKRFRTFGMMKFLKDHFVD